MGIHLMSWSDGGVQGGATTGSLERIRSHTAFQRLFAIRWHLSLPDWS